MKGLKNRIEQMNLYLNSREYPSRSKETIRGAESRMGSGKMTKSLDNTKSTRTSEKIKTSI